MLLSVLLALAVIMITARTVGAAFAKLNQPACRSRATVTMAIVTTMMTSRILNRITRRA